MLRVPASARPRAFFRLLPLAAALAACSPNVPAPGTDVPEAAAPSARMPDVVVYLVDTLRADALNIYGGPADSSPAIRAFARESAVFENALSQGSWTLPSVTSLFTSTYPKSHRVLDHFDRVGQQAETLAEYMKARGYHTVGFASNSLGGKSAGLDQGFDEYTEHPLKRDPRAAGEGHALQPLYDWLAADHGDEPRFLYVHTVEPHDPYHGSPADQVGRTEGESREIEQLQRAMALQRNLATARMAGTLEGKEEARFKAATRELAGREDDLRALYDGDVREADDNFQLLLNHMRGNPRWDDAVIVLLADHGEEFREHGSWFHGHSVFQELLHVPLVFRVPGLTDTGRRIAQPVQLIDVLPTLAELIGGPVDPQWQGRSLVPLLRGDALPEVPAIGMRTNNSNEELSGPRGRVETAVVEGTWKVIIHHELGRSSLYDLATDPEEQHDLAKEQPERAARMVEAALARLRDMPELDIRDLRALENGEEAERLRHLQDLGYVEGPGSR